MVNSRELLGSLEITALLSGLCQPGPLGRLEMEGETMRLIDADALIEAIKGQKLLAREHSTQRIMQMIISSTTFVFPERHIGQWLNFAGDFRTAECDKCGELYDVIDHEEPRKEYFDAFKQFYNYCPNCGAKMDGAAGEAGRRLKCAELSAENVLKEQE